MVNIHFNKYLLVAVCVCVNMAKKVKSVIDLILVKSEL